MAGWDGSGNFTRSYDWTDERDAEYNIDATKFDTENDNFATGIEACIAKNGENAATADLPMGGNKHTGVADGTAENHYATVKQAQRQGPCFATITGTANAIVGTISPVPSAISLGQVVRFVADSTNTAAATLDVAGDGAADIYCNGRELLGGEIVAGRTYEVIAMGGVGYRWHILNPIRMACQALRITDQEFDPAEIANITFPASETFDPDNLHSTVTNMDRILIPIIGLWMVTAHVMFDASTSGYTKYLAIKNSAGQIFVKNDFGDDAEKNVEITGCVYSDSTTDYVVLEYRNNDTATINVTDARFSAVYVG